MTLAPHTPGRTKNESEVGDCRLWWENDATKKSSYSDGQRSQNCKTWVDGGVEREMSRWSRRPSASQTAPRLWPKHQHRSLASTLDGECGETANERYVGRTEGRPYTLQRRRESSPTTQPHTTGQSRPRAERTLLVRPPNNRERREGAMA